MPKPKKQEKKASGIGPMARGAIVGAALGLGMSGALRTEAEHKFLTARAVRKQAEATSDKKKAESLRGKADSLDRRGSVYAGLAFGSIPAGAAAGAGLGAIRKRRQKRKNLRKKQHRN
jgi:hypothetical protein